ncbi:MAG: MFS transporter [Myxococcales bacterium]|nr:MFS transporter [Myxococcales bacterium]
MASVATGLATGFWSLLCCRVIVGVGEASLGPAVLSLLADALPATRRATAQSVYSAGVPLGAASAFWLGGYIGDAHGWRVAFLALGAPGIVLAAVVMLLHEPARASQAAQLASPFLPLFPLHPQRGERPCPLVDERARGCAGRRWQRRQRERGGRDHDRHACAQAPGAGVDVRHPSLPARGVVHLGHTSGVGGRARGH